ncbi:MAG: uroporphyrinogen-III synthase [Caldilineaceae bacterium]|nr:uroporphyrinogen-III synthase [Caldilineaceae bacterium]
MITAPTHTAPAKQANLAGVRVALARSEEDAQELRNLLLAQEAEVFCYPAIEILPFEDNEEFDTALRDAAAGRYDWLVLNDADVVTVVAEQMERLGIDPRTLDKTKIAAIGCMTEQNVQQYLGLQADFAPEQYTPHLVAEALGLHLGDRVLLPQSGLTRMALAKCLRNTGADVDAVNAYRTIIGRGGDPVPTMLWEGRIDVMAFTYPTEVRYFAKRLKYEGGTLDMLADVTVACIGPITAETAQSYSLSVTPVPQSHTYAGLVNQIIESVTG